MEISIYTHCKRLMCTLPNVFISVDVSRRTFVSLLYLLYHFFTMCHSLLLFGTFFCLYFFPSTHCWCAAFYAQNVTSLWCISRTTLAKFNSFVGKKNSFQLVCVILFEPKKLVFLLVRSFCLQILFVFTLLIVFSSVPSVPHMCKCI